MEKILITGVAGFIGYHLSEKLINLGFDIVGIDNLNEYYDVSLKHSRLNNLNKKNNFIFYKIDISNKQDLENIFDKHNFSYVINLAAQAGVRYSITNPDAYIKSNVIGFYNILELCRTYKINHLLYASSSSVYGGNKKIPFSENDMVDNPVSFYAATKKSNELMAYSYSNLYRIPTTGLRFFTVYGPYGRPDMAYYSFTKSIFDGETINIFNNGEMERDFTYIDDVVQAVILLLDKVPDNKKIPYRVLNIGNNKPIKLGYFIDLIEKNCQKKAKKNYLGMQDGDVQSTFANIDELIKLTGYQPITNVEKGIENFVLWYKDYYK